RAMLAPDDYQQGATVKIMFLHVPSAWLGMLCWALMTVAALGTLVWRHPLADVAAKAAAPPGAAFTLPCLVTRPLSGGPGVGAAGRGHFLGLGCAPDVGIDSVPSLFSSAGVVAHGRGPFARGARSGDPDHRRRHRPADHQILGRLVEYAAPRCFGISARRLNH